MALPAPMTTGEAHASAAMADVYDVPLLAPGVKRKNIHWTHVRTFNVAWVQPEQVTREETWKHLEKVYAEVYPVASSPTKSILAFGVVCQERHRASKVANQRDLHSHTPTVATGQCYWNKIAKLSLEKYNWPLNAVAHDSYSTMFAYVRVATQKKPLHEIDAAPYFSPLHPCDDALSDFLERSAKSESKRRGRPEHGERPKRERLPNLFEMIKEHNITTAEQLQARACAEAAQGRTALAEYCTKHGGKLHEIITNAKHVLQAPENLVESSKTLLQKLQAAGSKPCICGGCWQDGAKKLLEDNGIPPATFCGAVRRALHLGALRGVNVACVGDRGCGKSTLLEPLEFIFKCLPKPQAGSTFSLSNLPQCDVILWQDYLHNEKTVQFTDLLSLFVGESIGIRFVGRNEAFVNKAPIFYSGAMPMRSGHREHLVAEKLNGMMDDRFTTFSFTVSIPYDERKPDWPKCASCAAVFFMQGHDKPLLPLALPTGPSSSAASSSAASRSADAMAGHLRALAMLHDAGDLDDDEYRTAKRRILHM